jgi:hypothetical protein
VPLRLINCGLDGSLSAIDRVAVLVPGAVGLNVTLIEQLAPAGMEVPHVLVCEKSPGLLPDKETLVTDTAAVPELLTVTLCALLAVPTVWLPNVKLVLERVKLDGWLPYPPWFLDSGLKEGTPFKKSISLKIRVFSRLGMLATIFRVEVSITSPQSPTHTNLPSRLCCSQPSSDRVQFKGMSATSTGAEPGNPATSKTCTWL